jgi:hydrogenase maturation protease
MPAQQPARPFPPILSGRTVYVGVGHVLRGDDGLGPRLVARLKKRLAAPCIDAGASLERYLGRILRLEPDTVLLADAVHLGLEPGAWRILEPAELLAGGLSTHDLSLSFHLEELAGRLPGKIYLLGVQPRWLTLGRGLSAEVRSTLRDLEARIVEAENFKLVQTPAKKGTARWQ